MTLNEKVDTERWKYFVGFFIVGVFNNNGYTLVQAAASDLADTFKQQEFMAFFLFVMVFFGGFARLVNGACCVNIKHSTRVAIMTCFSLCSFLMIAVACTNDHYPAFFWIAVFASIFIGIS